MTNRLILTMIVKNESKTLPRLWSSVQSFIDGWVICDTGSTDTTLDFLQSIKDTSPIPGNYFQQEWKNFGHNRSLSFTTAQQWVQENQPDWDTSKCWSLLLDADMVLSVNTTNPKESIFALPEVNHEIRGFEFEQRQGGLHYKNIRMLRIDSPWNCVGKTHEYWNFNAPHDYHKMMRAVPTSILFIDDRGDGGARGDKYQRDEKLLREQLEETPDDSRTWFYLSQTLQDLGRWQEAHDGYLKRVSLGGWDEEKWMAALRAANCSYDGSRDSRLSEEERQKLWAQTVQECVSAWSMRPQRAESLYRLAHWSRIKGKNLEAWAWIQLGKQIPFPKDDKLFVEPHAYHDGWWDEISICAYYVRNQVPNAEKEAIDALEKLLIGRYKGNIESPAHRRRDMARSNRRFYPYPTLYKKPQLHYQGEWTPAKKGWNACNPSMIKHGDGFICSIRNVNYKIVNGSYVYPPDGEHCIDTATLIKKLQIEKDPITDLVEIHEKSLGWIPELPEEQRAPLRPKWQECGRLPVWGFEDVRLFSHSNQIYFTSTCLHIDGFIGTPRIVLGKLTDEYKVEFTIPLRVFNNGNELKGWYNNNCEKNWLPFSHEGKIMVVYSWEPLRIAEVNPETGNCQIIAENYQTIDCGAFRGSTCPVLLSANQPTPKFANASAAFESSSVNTTRFGCMVHEICTVSNKDVAREYYQRWVEFRITPKLEITYISEQFTLTDMTIEFPLSAIPYQNNDWVISWGHKDGRARWCVYNAQ